MEVGGDDYIRMKYLRQSKYFSFLHIKFKGFMCLQPSQAKPSQILSYF